MKKIRLYSPLKVTAYYYLRDEWGYKETDTYPTKVDNGLDYFEDIKNFIKNQNEKIKVIENERYTEVKNTYEAKGLMAYFDKKESEVHSKVFEKVNSAFVDISIIKENSNKRLFGVCDIEITEDLSQKELEILKYYLVCQYSDGYGEVLEQREIKIDLGEDFDEIYVNLWQNKNFFIKTEKEFLNQNVIDLYPKENSEIDFNKEQEKDNSFGMDM